MKTTFIHLLKRLIILFIICNNVICAQEFGKLRGFISDSTSGEVLPYANAYIEELRLGASTDIRGQFLISKIPAGKNYNVIISFLGYNSKTIKVFIGENRITEIHEALVPTGITLSTIEKYGEKSSEKNATDIGLQTLDIRQIETLPKSVEADVFRSLQLLPGVQTTGDVSARFYVRGGASDQNLILINGITIYNPFHALGLFSVIDPDMINSLDFYKGAFTSEYGGRLSSVVNIVTKDGHQNNLSAKLSSSYLSGKALVEGPIPNGSFILTARKNYKSDILKKFLNDQDLPISFYDYSYKLSYSNPDFLKNGKFILFGINTFDELNNSDPFQEDFNWSNNLFGFQWYQFYDIPLYTELTISSSRFKGEVIPNLSNSRYRNNSVSDLTLAADANYIFDSKNELGVGIQFKLIETGLKFETVSGLLNEVSEEGGNFSIYGKYKFLQWDYFGADFGTRLNISGVSAKGGSFFLEPRVNVTYVPVSWVNLKFGWGIYQQEFATFSDERDVISIFEPYLIIPKYLQPSTAIHYTVGSEFFLTSDLTLSIEGYYKVYKNLPELNDQKIYSWDKDFVSGSGKSYGWELYAKYLLFPVSFTLSYSLSWAYKTVDDWKFYPGYDTRHSLNIIFDIELGAGWKASATWLFNSGLPFTQHLGFYSKYLPVDFNDSWLSDPPFRQFLILDDKNLGRLSSYHRLDLSISKKFDLSFVKIYLDGSIINVYDRKNIFYYDRETGKQVNQLPFLPTATIKVEI